MTEAKTAAEPIAIEADVQTWAVGQHSRRFLSVTLPYRLARLAFRPELYDAMKGRGEQRPEIAAHVRHLSREMATGSFTPTSVSANLRRQHQKAVRYEFGRAYLGVDPGDPLPLTDGQQRFGAMRTLADAAAKAGDTDLLKQILDLPVSAVVHIDGNSQADFIALQAGRQVDAAHLMSLRAQQNLLAGKDADDVVLAQKVAKVLNAEVASPFSKFIRFDARGCGPIPITTVCARSASDLGVSLVGLAKVGRAAGVTDPKALAGYVIAAWKAVSQAPGLVGQGYPLCPPPDGTKGGATLLVGLGVCLAYRMKADGKPQPDADDLDRLLEAALAAFMTPLAGGLSSADKRALLKAFAQDYLGACGPMHHGVPLELQQILAPSAFGNPAFPKARKAAVAAATEEAEAEGTTEEPADDIDFSGSFAPSKVEVGV